MTEHKFEGLVCTDPDPEHIHDEGECCECGSTIHCCGSCDRFLGTKESLGFGDLPSDRSRRTPV